MVSDGKIPPKGSEFRSARSSVDNEGFADVNRHLQEAREQAGRYVNAQLDRLRAMVRSVILFGTLGIAGLVIGLAIVITAAVLLCIGVADGIGELLGGRQWAGDLIAGGAVLGLIAIGALIAVKRITALARRRTLESYQKQKSRGPSI
jgi:hypothetical protein